MSDAFGGRQSSASVNMGEALGYFRGLVETVKGRVTEQLVRQGHGFNPDSIGFSLSLPIHQAGSHATRVATVRVPEDVKPDGGNEVGVQNIRATVQSSDNPSRPWTVLALRHGDRMDMFQFVRDAKGAVRAERVPTAEELEAGPPVRPPSLPQFLVAEIFKKIPASNFTTAVKLRQNATKLKLEPHPPASRGGIGRNLRTTPSHG